MQIKAEPYHFPHDGSFSPQTTALLVIDMQRDFCEDSGYITESQGYEPLRSIINRVRDLSALFRTHGHPVYFTREGHRPDLSTLSSRELHRSRVRTGKGIGDRGSLGRFLVRGEPGHGIVPECEPHPGDLIIDKPGRSAFAHTDLELLLRFIVGVTTDVCVHSTMREANDRGFDAMLVEDATQAATQELHYAAIASVKEEGGIFGCIGRYVDLHKAIATRLSHRLDEIRR